MKLLDLDALQKRIRAANYCCGTPDQVAMWRKDLAEARANNAIDNIDLDNDDQALFAMMLDEGLSPPAMVEVIDNLYRKPDGKSALKIT